MCNSVKALTRALKLNRILIKCYGSPGLSAMLPTVCTVMAYRYHTKNLQKNLWRPDLICRANIDRVCVLSMRGRGDQKV